MRSSTCWALQILGAILPASCCSASAQADKANRKIVVDHVPGLQLGRFFRVICLVRDIDHIYLFLDCFLFAGLNNVLCIQVTFNPKDTSTFASASLDRTVKVWSIGQPTPNFTLEGHEKGVNCVDYFSGGDRPYLLSGADDKLAKVWDYQTKACVQVRAVEPAGKDCRVGAVVS